MRKCIGERKTSSHHRSNVPRLIVTGPESRFSLTSKSNKFVKSPNCVGTVPVNLFLPSLLRRHKKKVGERANFFRSSSSQSQHFPRIYTADLRRNLPTELIIVQYAEKGERWELSRNPDRQPTHNRSNDKPPKTVGIVPLRLFSKRLR